MKRVLPELDLPRGRTPTETGVPIPNDANRVARAQLAVKKALKAEYDAA